MKIELKTTFLLHHDPKLNLNRIRNKPCIPEHIGQYNLNCIIQTLSLRFMPVEITLVSQNNVNISFDRELALTDKILMEHDLENCMVLYRDEFIRVIPETNIWVTLC